MDNEMIKRVARALSKQHFMRKRHYGICTQEERVSNSVNKNWRNHENDAIAAIKAMREPTTKMVNAALHDYMYREKSKLPWNGKVMYHAMIDAIIND